MNKYLPFIIIATILLIGGAHFLLSTTKTTKPHEEDTNNKPVIQSHRSYEIDVTQKPNANQITLNVPTTIKYRIKNDKGEVQKNFAIAHEKLMHFIVVRKDLMQFQHLHPGFNEETGEFSVDVVFTVDGPYRFFADFTPSHDNPQKLPITVNSDLNIGDVSKFQQHEVIVDKDNKKTVPPNYQVFYVVPNPIESKSLLTYSIVIERDGEMVIPEKYLGALGHSVVLKEGTLEYIHTHAGEQSDMQGHDGHSMNSMQFAENKIDFTTTFPDAGKYKIFTQFQHEGKVYTTDYAVEVE